ncbi:hypothetical protein [Nitratireductor sp. XY-223]|uniref:hypothetical protein n=1 Tax=Nitratireductor sp. XY-223 TaxID=2561926 RepID=UPI0010AB35E4|nr:hypothetical protein [Nitratireductor sp. XY-223]
MTMSEGSASAGSLDAGNGEAAEGSAVLASDLLSGLDGDSRNWIDANGIGGETPQELLSGLVTKSREMESLIGRSVRLPGEDASEEDVAGFYDRVTERLRPDDPSGYEYALPEGLPEDMPYDADFVDAWRDFSHEMKLPAQVSAKAHDWFMQNAARAVEGRRQESQQFYEETLRSASKTLEENWGRPGSDAFNANQEYFSKAVNALGGDDLMHELKESGVIDPFDQITAPNLVIALSRVGRDFFTEDHMVTGQGGGKNPFADDSKNWGEQNAIIRDDPQRARNLIRAAGKDPRTYKL